MDERCREILDDLEIYLDGECTHYVGQIIARHLEDCGPCLDRAGFEREVRAVVARCCRDAAPPGLVDRVIDCVRDSGAV